jgi:hypothetical protein
MGIDLLPHPAQRKTNTVARNCRNFISDLSLILIIEIMKTLIVLALAGVALPLAARYFKINSFEQVKGLIPEVKNLIPKAKKILSYS